MQLRVKKKIKSCIALMLTLLITMIAIFQVTSLENSVLVWGGDENKKSSYEPIYNSEEHKLKYSKDSLSMKAQTSEDFGITISSDVTYYATYTIKTQGDCWFSFRGNTGRVFIGAKQYAVVGVENEKWIQKEGVAQTKEGARVTICSSKNKVSVWLNGDKIVDNATLTATGKAGQPKIDWITDSATFADVKVWINKEDDVTEPDSPSGEVTDEPSYSSDKDKIWYNKEKIELAAFSSYDFKLKFKTKDTYIVSYRVKTKGDIYFGFRGDKGRFYISATQYCALGVENEQWVQEKGIAEATNGAKVTIKSNGEKASVWLNGKKILDNANLVAKDECGIPKVSWTTDNTTLTDVKIWADKSVQTIKEESTEPAINIDKNEPKYDKTKHNLKFKQSVLNISSEEKENFGVTIAAKNTYYTSFVLKTKGDFYYDFRGDTGRIYIGPNQYCIIGVENEQWVQSPGLASGSDGVRVTICSNGDAVSVWFNGVRVAYNEKLKDRGKLGLPKVTWTTDKVILENIKVWTDKNQDDTVRPVGSNEPIYNDKTDYKYDIERVTNGIYKDGILSLAPEKTSFFLSELPYNASYYVTMMIKTEGAVNIQTRSPKDVINISKDGYTSLATGQNWVNRKFPTLSNGARVTIRSTGKKITVWVDGEKIVDGKYKNKDIAQPGIGWSFNDQVTVKDINIWTNKKYKSDEPMYNKMTDELHSFAYEGKVKAKGKTAKISPQNIVGFISDFDADADYYMSLVVKTKQSVNIMYRNPDGVICLSQDGYESSGTNGEWTKKTFYKLPFGVRVTLHSTPKKVTVWVDGEKLVDTSYSKNGESYPGIAWSFDKPVEVSNIKLWSTKTKQKIDLGVTGETARSSLSADKVFQVGLLKMEEDGGYMDKQLMPRNVYATSVDTKLDSKVNVIKAEKESDKSSLHIDVVAEIIGAIVLGIGVAVFGIVRKRKINS